MKIKTFFFLKSWNISTYLTRSDLAETPFGALPTLEVDGEVLCQSKTISRYLAKLAGEIPNIEKIQK